MPKIKLSTTALPDIDELPPTMPIPECGALFFGVNGPASYRLERAGSVHQNRIKKQARAAACARAQAQSRSV